MISYRQFFLTLLICACGCVSQAAVWNATNSWNDDWEQRYSHWVTTQMDANYFVLGPYGAIATDCADAVYAARLIFSYENRLPFFASGYSEKSKSFDGIQDSRSRFKAFLQTVLQGTSTLTLANDTYPIAINRKVLRSGAVFLQKRVLSGHVELIHDVRSNGVIEFLSSTLPIKVRRLLVSTSLTVMPADISSGFRAWIRPEQRGLPVSILPGFSTEQFRFTKPATSEQLKIWLANIQNKLALEPESSEDAVARLGKDICSLVQSRVEVVLDGYEYKNKVRRCLTRDEYDAYSTPGKDRRILRIVEQTLTFLYPDQQKLELEMIDALAHPLASCLDVHFFPERSLNILDFLKKLAGKQVANDPNETVNERWGISPPNGNHCPQY